MHSTFKKSLLASTMIMVIATGTAAADGPYKKDHSAGYINNTTLDSALAKANKERLTSRRVNGQMTLIDRVLFWHGILNDLVALDHTPEITDDGIAAPLVNGGPTRTSRAQAIVMIAMYDSLCVFADRFECYTPEARAMTVDGGQTEKSAAISHAAHTTLLAMYPNRAAMVDEALAADLASLPGTADEIDQGRQIGLAMAAAILTERTGDGSEISEVDWGEGGRVADGGSKFDGAPVNNGSLNIFEWSPDGETPVGAPEFNLALGASWGAVTPFALANGAQFRNPPPPEPGSPAYIDAYTEVYSLGVSQDFPFATGTPETYFIGNYWGYDGVPLIGVPPRLYAQIAAQVGQTRAKDPLSFLRFLTAFHVGMADTAIAAWDSKYFYNFARPVRLIREDDGVPGTIQEPNWTPVGTSIVNVELEEGQAFFRPTPPFPSYPSGHAAFGANLGEFLRDLIGDEKSFTFVSDEYNGLGLDPFPDENGEPTPRPLVPVRFENATEAQLQNGRSRIFNGVHWNFDDGTGQQIGLSTARWVMDNTTAFSRR